MRSVLAQAETVTALRVACEALWARVAELEAKLGLPPKTPDNSSMPPSRGRKASEGASPKPNGRPHAGAHQPPHPNLTRRFLVLARCEHCAATLSAAAQVAPQAYDRTEVPEIRPDVARVTLHGARAAPRSLRPRRRRGWSREKMRRPASIRRLPRTARRLAVNRNHATHDFLHRFLATKQSATQRIVPELPASATGKPCGTFGRGECLSCPAKPVSAPSRLNSSIASPSSAPHNGPTAVAGGISSNG
ncbi:MAG: hypothetical protein WBF43_08855 [Methylocella sp.]